MAECIKCKADLPDGAVFCPSCGKKQSPEPRKHHKRSNGTGSISKLAGNRAKPWLARRNGVCLGTYATRTEAQKALERVTDASITDKYNLTFRQIYEAWKPVQERKVTSSQMSCYVTSFNNCPELHDKQFRRIKKSDFQNVIIRLEQAGRSKSMCEKMRQLFSQLSKWALAEEITQTNHAQHLDTVAKQLTAKAVFTEADIQAVQKSSNRGAPIVLILLACGCRPNELFNVPLADCYEDYFIGGSKTAAGTHRPIVISPLGIDAYQQLRSNAIRNGGTKLIDGFEGNRDQHNFAKREFRDLAKEIEHPDLTMYCCRHTYITNAARSGVDQRALQQMVGHVDQQTTRIYTHLDVGHLRNESQKITTNAVCNKSVTGSASQI